MNLNHYFISVRFKARVFFRFSEASQSLLGSFEESVLKGRIEPVSTVEGFTAEIGASGSFCPDHVQIPVTVFFYSFCNNDKVSMPYMVRFMGKLCYYYYFSFAIYVCVKVAIVH